jgi:hypothetical protein
MARVPIRAEEGLFKKNNEEQIFPGIPELLN